MSDMKKIILNGTEYELSSDSGEGITSAVKLALLQLASKVAYIDENGQDYYDALYDALYAITDISISPSSLSFATLNMTQQLTATTTPEGGAVTWASSNTSVATVSSSGVVTSVGYGSATITATASGIVASCSVVVAQATVTSISAVYTQSGTVYDSASLDSLKSDLVVTATWSNNTTSTVASADYTLSGTLTVGTSTVTVSYASKTTTFTVTVTADPVPNTYARYDYIKGDGAAWLDTGLVAKTYAPTASYEWTIKFAIGEDVSQAALYNIRQRWQSNTSRGIWTKNLTFSINLNGSGDGYTNSVTSVDDIVTVRTTGTSAFINDVETTRTGTADTISQTGTIALFADCTGATDGSGYVSENNNTSGYVGAFGKHKIYEFIIKNSSNEEVAHLIPVKRISDNVAGMYDIVRSVFCINGRDSGTLTVGND